MLEYSVKDKPFNLLISFPWERGTFIRVRIFSQDGVEIQDYTRTMPAGLLAPYTAFLTTIKALIHKAMTS